MFHTCPSCSRRISRLLRRGRKRKDPRSRIGHVRTGKKKKFPQHLKYLKTYFKHVSVLLWCPAILILVFYLLKFFSLDLLNIFLIIPSSVPSLTRLCSSVRSGSPSPSFPCPLCVGETLFTESWARRPPSPHHEDVLWFLGHVLDHVSD